MSSTNWQKEINALKIKEPKIPNVVGLDQNAAIKALEIYLIKWNKWTTQPGFSWSIFPSTVAVTIKAKRSMVLNMLETYKKKNNNDGDDDNKKEPEKKKEKIYGKVPRADDIYQVMLPIFNDNKSLVNWEVDNLTDKEKEEFLNVSAHGHIVGIEYEKTKDGDYRFRKFIYSEKSNETTTNFTSKLPNTKKLFQDARNRIVKNYKIPTAEEIEKAKKKGEKVEGTPLQPHEGTIEEAKKMRQTSIQLHDAIQKPQDGKKDGYYNNPRAFDRQIHRILNIRPELGVKDEGEDPVWQFFDRYYSIYPEIELTSLTHYIFMTRPNLNLFDKTAGSGDKITLLPQTKNWPLAYTIWKQNPWILKALTKQMTSHHSFMPLITSRIEMLQWPDYQIKNYTVNQPYTSYLLPYGSNGISSTTGGSFDMELREMWDLSLHKYFQIWLEYISKLTLNELTADYKNITENRADYMVSLYDIICAPDARTILYWNKYVGCFPVLNPNSSLSFNRGDRGADNKLSVQFNYFYSKPLDPMALVDFNRNAGLNDPKRIQDAIKNETHYVEPSGHTFANVPILEYGTGYAFALKPFTKLNPSTKFFELGWVKRQLTKLTY